MSGPLIGLTGRQRKGDQIQNNLAVLANVDVDLYFSDYSKAIIAAGGIPVHLPLDLAVVPAVDRLDGLLLTGGADIDPGQYGHAAAVDADTPEPARDEFELAVLNRAMERELPALGICRGVQLMNVACGGTLHQHLPEHAKFDRPIDELSHTVQIEQPSVLHELYGSERQVNSLHHQAVDTVGEGLRVSANADDGTIEALEHQTLPMIAVQWHPEMMTTAKSDPIFAWLVGQAAT